jgi:S-methylmethionine-dependent homocysteine/selenocysteine methylase
MPLLRAPSEPLILDGGMGRQLQAMGAPFRQPEWSALALIEVHTPKGCLVALRCLLRR